MVINRDKHNKFFTIGGSTGSQDTNDSQNQPSGDNNSNTGSSTGSTGGSTTIIYQGGGMTENQSNKLNGIEEGAEKNQDAFSYITIQGATGEEDVTLSADDPTDTFKLAAKNSITLSLEGDVITIGCDGVKYLKELLDVDAENPLDEDLLIYNSETQKWEAINPQFATIEWVNEQFDKIIGSAPEVLDTIYEIAEALGNDPDYVKDIANNLSALTNRVTITEQDITDIKNTIERFEDSCNVLSEGKMTADCDIYEIQAPITSLSYDNEFGYYVAPEDIEEQIKDIINQNNYDHIFAVVRLGNEEHEDDIEIKDWIGLGSMDYYGIGFSNIRLPNSSKSYIYKYDVNVNQFPEEVFLHEFLHSLERTSKEYGYTIPALHDYKEYGYENEYLIGQRQWYKDYMNQEINTSQGYVGLPNEIYTLKPAKKSNFDYAFELNVYQEPQNIIEEIRGVFNNLFRNIKLLLGKV